MGFTDAIQVGFQKYAVFDGRASRSEYWYWFLFTFVAGFAAGFIAGVPGISEDVLAGVAWLVLLLPSLAVGVRRLHDMGRSGGNLFWALIPFGALVVLFFLVQPSESGVNRYGPQPGLTPLEV